MPHAVITEYNTINLSQQKMLQMAAMMKPLLVGDDGFYFMQEPVDLKKPGYHWGAVKGDHAQGLVELPLDSDYSTTYHRYHNPYHFKPSLETAYEAISKLPNNIQDQIVAFSVRPRIEDIQEMPDLNEMADMLEEGHDVAMITHMLGVMSEQCDYHCGRLRVFTGTLPEIVKQQAVIYEGKENTAAEIYKKTALKLY